jgi:hypothetical protein
MVLPTASIVAQQLKSCLRKVEPPLDHLHPEDASRLAVKKSIGSHHRVHFWVRIKTFCLREKKTRKNQNGLQIV